MCPRIRKACGSACCCEVCHARPLRRAHGGAQADPHRARLYARRARDEGRARRAERRGQLADRVACWREEARLEKLEEEHRRRGTHWSGDNEMDVDEDEAGLVSAKGPRAKRQRAEDDEAESEGGDEPKVLEVRKGKGKGKEKEKEKQTAVKEVGVKKGKVKVSYMRSREGSFIEVIIFFFLHIYSDLHIGSYPFDYYFFYSLSIVMNDLHHF